MNCKRIVPVVLAAVFTACFALAKETTARDHRLVIRPTYPFRAPISVSGYSGSSTLTNFPVLVRISENSPAGFSYGDCETDGSDIRFMDAADRILPHEIDTWNPQGESCIWVKLPTMGQGTQFEMRYGGLTSTDYSPSAVWSAFGGVWHMNENAATQTDRTGNGLVATTDSGVTYELAAGPVGQSLKKSGILRTADFFETGLKYTVPSASYTVSGWYWWPDYGFSANANPLQKGVWGQNGWYLQHKTSKTPVRERMILVFRDVSTENTPFTVPNCATHWNYLTVVVTDTSHFTVFVNGVSAFSYTYSNPNYLPGSYPFIIGSVMGYADETRVMRSAVSADWVAADYATQTGTLLSYGAAALETRPLLIEGNASVGYTTFTLPVILGTAGDGASSATVSFAYGTDPANLSAPTVLASGLATGFDTTANLTGLSNGTTYHFEISAVNDASPAQSYTKSGSFTTLSYTAPTAAATPCNLVRPSFVGVEIADCGGGSDTCDVYFAYGENEGALPALTLAATGVAAGTIVTNVVPAPQNGLFTHYAVRVVNEQGLEWTATGTFMPDDAWTYNTSAKTISDQGGWKFPVSSFTTLESGLRELSIGRVGTYGTNSVLDFRKPIVWTTEEAFDSAAFVAFNKDCMYSETDAVTELHLPDTVRTLGEYCFRGLRKATVIEPFIPNSVTSCNAPFGVISSFKGDLVLGGGGLDLALAGNADSVRRASVASITFGTGAMTVPYQFFYGCTGCTNITFLGDSVRWNNSAFQAWNNYQALIRVPATSTWWADFLATDSTFVAWDSVSAANQKTYWTKFDPQRAGDPPLGVVKLGSNAALQYIATYLKETTTRDLFVEGLPFQIGEVSPAYTSAAVGHENVAAAVPCEAPEYAGLDGVYYRCAGYVTETMGATGWVNPVTNLGVRSFTYGTEVGMQRVTWLWDVAGYAVTGVCAYVEGYDLGSVTQTAPFYPGHYALGSSVTLTATPSDASVAPFDRWCGEAVPVGHERDNPLVLTADAVKTVYPYFRKNWVYAGGNVTDGYWKFKASVSGGTKVTLGGGSGQATLSNSTVWQGGFLDLAKPFDGDYTLVSVVKDFVYGSNPGVGNTIRALTLPDTLTTLNEYCFQSCPNLKSVTPFVPASVTSINSAFSSCAALTNALVIGSWKTNTVSVLGGLSWQRTTSIPSITFGRGVKSLPHQMCYGNNGVKNVYFMGDVPTGGNAFEGCAAYGKCFHVPRGNASWAAWLATNLVRWSDLSGSEQDKYWARFPDGRRPLGYANFSSGSKMWFLYWSPHPVGTVVTLR